MSNKKKALGRGLSALLDQNNTSGGSYSVSDFKPGTINELPVTSIETNPFQPRTHFEEQALQELAASIKEHGIIQPITVRQTAPNHYQLISGERRFRASQMAGLTRVPAYIRIADDGTMLEMALVENIQRSDLNAIEIAISYQRLMDECELTQEELGKKVSKNRATVTNYLRLLKLSAPVQLAIKERAISMGHARALVSVQDEKAQKALLKKVLSEDLSVRATEELARETKTPDQPKRSVSRHELTFVQQKHVDELKTVLETGISIRTDQTGKGKITIDFKDDEDLSRILDILNP
jgi:ParB family chromosome partitioning protein